MEVDKHVIKTYSRRLPITRYESRAVLIPSHPDPQHVRESRLNDKTLVVDNFDDTFDRLATGVVVPSAENSLNEDGFSKRKVDDLFETFKMPLQAKKNEKPKQKGKPKKKDVVSKAAMKRKKVDIASDDSGSSDQEENHKNKSLVSNNKKSKEKIKKVVKKKKQLSPVKVMTKIGVVVTDDADENLPNNIESNNKDCTEVINNLEQPTGSSSVNQCKILQHFQASTPRVDKKYTAIDMQNISPVVREKNLDKDKECLTHLSVKEVQAEKVTDDANSEHFNDNLECNQKNSTEVTDAFVKSRESMKIHQLKGSNHVLTSTPRINKVRTPVNLQHLSPIISDQEKRVIGVIHEESPDLEANGDENCIGESNSNGDDDVTSEQVSEPAKSLTKLCEYQHNDVDDFSKQNDIGTSVETSSAKTISLRQQSQPQLQVSSDVTSNKNNPDEKTNGTETLESIEVQSMAENQDYPVLAACDNSNAEQLVDETCTGNNDLQREARSFAQSPLLFDDSEFVQSPLHKSKAVPNIVIQDIIDINFSQHLPEKIEKNKKDSASTESTCIQPGTNKGKNFDVSSESSYYPDDWTNEYDSTYGYDQIKKNLEKDTTANSKLGKDEDENSSSLSEKTNNTSVENVTEVSNEDSTGTESADNTVIQSIKDQKQIEHSTCDEDDNVTLYSKNESDEQEKSHKDVDAASDSNENNLDLVNGEEESTIHSDEQEERHKDLDDVSVSNGNNLDSLNGEEESIEYSDEQEESHKNIGEASILSENKLDSVNREEESKLYSDEQEENHKDVDATSVSNGNNLDSLNGEEESIEYSDEQEESHKNIDEASILSENNLDSVNREEESKLYPDEQEENHKNIGEASENNLDSVNGGKDIVHSPIIVEEITNLPGEDESHTTELDESIAKPGCQDSDDDSLMLSERPSKRRKTDTREIMIFNKVGDSFANIQNKEEISNESKKNSEELISPSEDVNNECVNGELSNRTMVDPICQYNIMKNKELRLVLERINYKNYKSPISSRTKPVKSKKRLSRKSSDIHEESIPKKTQAERATKSNVTRVTRRSVTEDKMKRLYVQHQCKDMLIIATRLEDQKFNSSARRSLKRKSRESSITENNEQDSSLTNGRLSEFLSKLKDPVKVTTRRKTHKRYDGPLAAINEDQANQNANNEVGKKAVRWGNDKRVTFDHFDESSEDIEDIGRKSQPIFLKPGKSWARSLSIINHFQNGKNLDELAAGRENWRCSVQNVLNMQTNVSDRHSSQIHEETRRESRASRASSHRASKSMRKSSNAASSRFSMRIIPSGKRSTLSDDLLDSPRISYVSDRSRASRKTSLKIRRDTLIETEDDLIKSAKDIILKRCKQTTYEPFDVCFPDSYIENCRKIGEGVYGEVFLYEDDSEKAVIKIIPIEGDQLVNCEPQKKFHEILSEIIIAEELHKLRFEGEFQTNGFVEVNRIMCVIGKYPDKMIDLWYAYDEQKKSENDCPSMFEDDQLYIILELAHGGQDLEAYQFQNASESYAIFLQTALTLAVAERSLEFEHRDLHWGNLLISKTEDKQSSYKLDGQEISLATRGVKVAVIDFTLSRMSYRGCKIFNDLAADPSLFEAQGEYQFDIYRMMRDNVDDDWQRFNPFTNVLWMDYTLDKMITAARYKRKTTKIHKSAIDDMKALRKEIMKYSSAFDFVTNCKRVQDLFDST